MHARDNTWHGESSYIYTVCMYSGICGRQARTCTYPNTCKKKKGRVMHAVMYVRFKPLLFSCTCMKSQEYAGVYIFIVVYTGRRACAYISEYPQSEVYYVYGMYSCVANLALDVSCTYTRSWAQPVGQSGTRHITRIGKCANNRQALNWKERRRSSFKGIYMTVSAYFPYLELGCASRRIRKGNLEG